MKAVSAARAESHALSAARLPDLRIVPSSSLLLHEECDPARVERLARALSTEAVLRNPPVVASLDAGMHVVLDGAHRVTVLAQAGYPHELVQVVIYDDPAITLEVWAHLLPADGARTLAPAHLQWQPMSEDAVRAGLDAGTLACGIVTPGEARGLPADADLARRITAIREVVAGYRGTTFYRVQPLGLDVLGDEYGEVGALVMFPRLTKADIRTVAGMSLKLPTGITRHIVPQRALRVNLDLALLKSDEPLPDKQRRLDDLLRTRVIEHRVRHYPESTVLFDE